MNHPDFHKTPGQALNDTLHAATTPEGLRFELRLAGPFVRGLAFSIDAGIQGILVIVLAIFIKVFLNQANWFLLLSVFLIQWFFGALFEGFNKGKTPGKLLMGLQVVHRDGSLAGFGPIMIRNLVRSADMFYFCFFLGLAIIGASSRFQRLGDHAADTIVIYQSRKKQAGTSFQPEADVQPIPPPIPLDPGEAQAIISFAQRCREFSPARSRDLAGVAISRMYGKDQEPEDPVAALNSIAAWLAGYRPGLGVTRPEGRTR